MQICNTICICVGEKFFILIIEYIDISSDLWKVFFLWLYVDVISGDYVTRSFHQKHFFWCVVGDRSYHEDIWWKGPFQRPQSQRRSPGIFWCQRSSEWFVHWNVEAWALRSGKTMQGLEGLLLRPFFLLIWGWVSCVCVWVTECLYMYL